MDDFILRKRKKVFFGFSLLLAFSAWLIMIYDIVQDAEHSIDPTGRSFIAGVTLLIIFMIIVSMYSSMSDSKIAKNIPKSDNRSRSIGGQIIRSNELFLFLVLVVCAALFQYIISFLIDYIYSAH